MAKFCTNCGKKLVDGKPCDCMKKQSKKVEEVEVVESNAGDMLNDFLEAFKGIFAKPVETMKKYANSSKIILVMIMIAVNSLVFGLYVYLFAKESIGLFSSSLLGIGRAASVPASVFFWPFLFMIVFFFALAGLLYLFCGPVLKDEADFKQTKKLFKEKGYDPRYYVVCDDQSQVPYLYFDHNDVISEIEILVAGKLRFLPEVSEIVGAIINSKNYKDDRKIFYPEE